MVLLNCMDNGSPYFWICRDLGNSLWSCWFKAFLGQHLPGGPNFPARFSSYLVLNSKVGVKLAKIQPITARWLQLSWNMLAKLNLDIFHNLYIYISHVYLINNPGKRMNIVLGIYLQRGEELERSNANQQSQTRDQHEHKLQILSCEYSSGWT